MRKIEQKMMDAIKNGKSICLGNTEVRFDNSTNECKILLFGNEICTIYPNEQGDYQMHLRDAGWKTSTTKSRLNALLSISSGQIFQAAGVWYYRHYTGKIEFFRRGVTIPFDWNWIA
jgi:hypothetical protein